MTTIVETFPEVKPPSLISCRSLECGDYFIHNNAVYQLCEGDRCFNVTTGRVTLFPNISCVLPIKRLTLTYTT